MDKKILGKLLEAGIQAPSGDNAQPWRFKIIDNKLYIYCVPDADESYYDYKQRGSFIAHGAVIENIIIAAETFGYKVNIRIFPHKEEPNLTAILEFKPIARKQHDLYDAIFERVTNRKKYKSIRLSEKHKKEFFNLTKKYSNFRLILIEDNEEKRKISEALSFNDRFFLEDKHTHKNLFSKIRWTSQEAEKIRTGLYIKTLELAPPEEIMMKLLRNWEILKLLRKLGISKMIPKSTSSLYNTSSAIGIVVMQGKQNKNFIMAGRFIQRLWLTATKLGVAFAPVTAVPYLAARIEENDKGAISKEHIRDALNANKIIKDICGIKNETICMIFRLGYADKPSAYSNRLPFEKVLRS